MWRAVSRYVVPLQIPLYLLRSLKRCETAAHSGIGQPLDSYLTIEPKHVPGGALVGAQDEGRETREPLDRSGDNTLMRVGAEGGI